jgi:hypothetical protein
MAAVTPLALGALVIVVLVIRAPFFIRSETSTSATQQRSASHVATCSFALLVLSYIVTPPAAKALLAAMDCYEFEHNGYSFLRKDSNIDCESDQYRRFLVFAGAMACVYLSLPLMWFVLLYRVRAQLNPANVKMDAVLRNRQHDPKLSNVAFLFSDFKPHAWWFEPLDTYRRIFYVAVLPLFSVSDYTLASIAAFTSCLWMLAMRELQPYTKNLTSLMLSASQLQLFLIYFGASVYLAGGLDEFDDSTIGSAFVAVSVLVVFCMWVVSYLRLQRYRNLIALPAGMLWHFFLSHFQANSGDQCNAIFLALSSMGFLVWCKFVY